MRRTTTRTAVAALALGTTVVVSLSGCRRDLAVAPTTATTSTATTSSATTSTATSDSIVVAGLTRTYLVHRPASLPTHPALVLSLHGGGGTAAGQERLTGYDTVADTEHFVVAYPQGYDNGWADGRGTNKAEQQHVDDVAFISALIDRLIATDAVDPARVYVSGFSNGGFMTQRLGCDLAGRIAAIAPVAGTLGTSVACAPSRPISVLEIHGTDDPIVPFSGGRMTVEAGGPSTIVAAPDMVARWRTLDGCPATAPTTVSDKVDDGTSVRLSSSEGCSAQTAVAFYEVDGGGHTWPQGRQYLPAAIIGRTSQEFSAAKVSWDFFRSHPKT